MNALEYLVICYVHNISKIQGPEFSKKVNFSDTSEKE